MSQSVFKKIIAAIERGRNFLITAHVNVEGDALGSCLGVYGMLKNLGKRAVIYNNDYTPEIYRFLPYVQRIRSDLDVAPFDAAFVLDCSDASRAGRVKDYLTNAECIINIDHHISNTYFGDINWVDAAASSTCQMLYRLGKEFKVIDKKVALCLYTGIATDTGNFTYANATAETHWIISRLMKYNINPHKIYESLHSACGPGDLRFLGKVISGLRFDPKGKICWASIVHWKESVYDLTEILFNMMRLLKGVEVFVLFKKIDSNKTRVNFRSRAKVDVNKVAQFFGGGGHKRASGTTLGESLESAERNVISFVKRYTNGFRRPKSG